MKLCAIAVVMAALSSPLLSQTPIFQDNFERNAVGSNWTARYGQWSIEGNRLKHVGNGNDINVLLYNVPVSISSYTIICDITWQSGGYFEDGITFFHKVVDLQMPGLGGGKTDDYWHASLSNYNGKNDARLVRYLNRNGGAAIIGLYGRWDTIPNPGRKYHFAVQVTKTSGTAMQVRYFIDSMLVVHYEGVNDNAILGDQVGLGGYEGAHGQTVYYDNFAIYPGLVNPMTDVAPPSTPTIPNEMSVGQNYPNPFNPSTRIDFDLATRSPITVQVFNATGQLVRTLLAGEEMAGRHSIVWDSKDNNGNQVASGAYFYQVRSRGELLTKKMTLVK